MAMDGLPQILPRWLTVGAEVGAGAHGVVRSGALNRNGRRVDVAIKFMPGLVGPREREAFAREVQHLSS